MSSRMWNKRRRSKVKKELEKFDELGIKDKIYSIRGYQVMFDVDLAELYGVELKRLNEQVKRNIDRFPSRYSFVLNIHEFRNLKSQIATSSWGGKRKLPRVFTEHGVSMLSSVLRSDIAIEVSIQIIDAFISMRKFINSNAKLFNRVGLLENKQFENEQNFRKIFELIESKDITPEQGIFFKGQIFDAYKFVSDLFRKAKRSIMIIDNYVDDTVLVHLTKIRKNVKVKILTKSISDQFKLDINKFRKQYFLIEVEIFKKSHDRFIIIDDDIVYHFGASLKDLGRKLFGFSKMDKDVLRLMEGVLNPSNSMGLKLNQA